MDGYVSTKATPKYRKPKFQTFKKQILRIKKIRGTDYGNGNAQKIV